MLAYGNAIVEHGYGSPITQRWRRTSILAQRVLADVRRLMDGPCTKTAQGKAHKMVVGLLDLVETNSG